MAALTADASFGSILLRPVAASIRPTQFSGWRQQCGPDGRDPSDFVQCFFPVVYSRLDMTNRYPLPVAFDMAVRVSIALDDGVTTVEERDHITWQHYAPPFEPACLGVDCL